MHGQTQPGPHSGEGLTPRARPKPRESGPSLSHELAPREEIRKKDQNHVLNLN